MATSTLHGWTKEENETKKPMDKVKDAGAHVVDKAKEIVAAPLEKAKEMGSQAVNKAKEVAGVVGDMASDAVSAAGQKADDVTAAAGQQVKNLGQAMGEKGPHDGVLGAASQAVANTVKGAGEYVAEAKLSGMAEDLTSLVKNHPIPAMLACIGIGYLIARIMKD